MAATAPEGTHNLPTIEAAALLTELSKPESLHFILVTTERVQEGGGKDGCSFTVKDEVDHHGRVEATNREVPCPGLCRV